MGEWKINSTNNNSQKNISKEYYFEIESGDKKNVALNRNMKVYFMGNKYDNKVVGNYKDKRISLSQQKIIFEK